MRSVLRAVQSALRPIALWLSVMAVLTGAPALAETGNGSKNFRAPASVPNYFSNEAGPTLGGPAESRRVDLYPNPANRAHQVDTVTAPPSARTRHIATRHGRVHLAAHARGGRHPAAARGHTRTHYAARGGPPNHAKHAAASHTTHVTNAHHRGRG
jgi:hypothetical protein